MRHLRAVCHAAKHTHINLDVWPPHVPHSTALLRPLHFTMIWVRSGPTMRMVSHTSTGSTVAVLPRCAVDLNGRDNNRTVAAHLTGTSQEVYPSPGHTSLSLV
jgi:hypothetical protein